MHQYLDLLDDVMKNGVLKGDRTGTGTRSVFGRMLRFNLSEGFPIVTTKTVHFHSVMHELLWFIRGDSNIEYLTENGVKIWNEWADQNGDLGPVYGVQWRKWLSIEDDGESHTVDQLASVIYEIQTNPNSRRMMVNSWAVHDLPEMKLPPCHFNFQFNVTWGRLSCHMSIRSCDLFLGLPFNIASYALLTHMVAQATGNIVGDLVISIGDAHIYRNHFDQVKEQLERTPYVLPTLVLQEAVTDINRFKDRHIKLIGYQHHAPIKAPISV